MEATSPADQPPQTGIPIHDLPMEIVRDILKYLLPYQQKLVFGQDFYLKRLSNRSKRKRSHSPAQTAVLMPPQQTSTLTAPSRLSVLLVSKHLHVIARDLLYAGNAFAFDFQASWVYKTPHKRFGWIQWPPSNSQPGSSKPVSGFEYFPADAARALRHIEINIREDFRRGTLELRECFENFARTLLAYSNGNYSNNSGGSGVTTNLQHLTVTLENSPRWDWRGGTDDAPLSPEARSFDQARVRYILAPLLRFHGLRAVEIKGEVDEAFAKELVRFMTAGEVRRVARTRFQLGIQSLDWMRSAAIEGSDKAACY